jgi:hypothetical protein
MNIKKSKKIIQNVYNLLDNKVFDHEFELHTDKLLELLEILESGDLEKFDKTIIYELKGVHKEVNIVLNGNYFDEPIRTQYIIAYIEYISLFHYFKNLRN